MWSVWYMHLLCLGAVDSLCCLLSYLIALVCWGCAAELPTYVLVFFYYCFAESD